MAPPTTANTAKKTGPFRTVTRPICKTQMFFAPAERHVLAVHVPPPACVLKRRCTDRETWLNEVKEMFEQMKNHA